MMTVPSNAAQTATATRARQGATKAADAPWLPITDMIDVGHSKLAYRHVGEGPDLVFVHGWPLHAATFRGLLPRLSKHYSCHLFDLPGTGDSEWSRASRIGLREHADSVRIAIDQLGLERYALIGHDSGALITRLIAADNPKVAGLVAGNTEIPHHFPWQVKMYELTARVPGGLAAFGLMLRSRTFRRSQLALGGCFADLAQLDGEFHQLFIQPLLDNKRTMVGQIRLVFGLDHDLIDNLENVHARISAPVQLIWGVDDPFFPLDKAKPMLAQFPAGAEWVELSPGKLFVHEERPAAFCDAAMPFLKRCFTAPS